MRVGLRTTAALTVFMIPNLVCAGDSWVGKTILTKKSGVEIRIKDSTTNSDVVVGHLWTPSYVVRGDEGDSIRVFEPSDGKEGWFPKSEAVLIDNGVEYFTDVINSDPTNVLAFIRRSLAWRWKGELDNAIKDLDVVIRFEPEEPYGWGHRGLVWLTKKEYDKAIQDFDTALNLDPTNMGIVGNRGNAWSAKKQYDKAIGDYNEAIKLSPKNPLSFNNRGMAWQHKGKYDKAIEDFNYALQLDPDYASAFCNRALTRAKMKQFDEAIHDFDKALALAPLSESARRDVAEFRATCPEAKYRDGKKAVELALKAIELAGKRTDWQFYSALAAAFAECGEFEKAVIEQTKVLADKSLDREDREKMKKRLGLYKERKAFRDDGK